MKNHKLFFTALFLVLGTSALTYAYTTFPTYQELVPEAGTDKPGVSSDDFQKFLTTLGSRLQTPMPMRGENFYQSLGLDGFNALIKSVSQACVATEWKGQTYVSQQPLLLPGQNGFSPIFDLRHIIDTFFSRDLTNGGSPEQVLDARAAQDMRAAGMKVGSQHERNTIALSDLESFVQSSDDPALRKTLDTVKNALDVMRFDDSLRQKLRSEYDKMLAKMKDVSADSEARLAVDRSPGSNLSGGGGQLEICNSDYAQKRQLFLDFIAAREKIAQQLQLNFTRPLNKAVAAYSDLRESYLKAQGNYHAPAYESQPISASTTTGVNIDSK